jgi:hypothetical protein
MQELSEIQPRLFLVQRLREQLLGPRLGMNELLPLNLDPRDEYVCGILEPSLGWDEQKSEPELDNTQMDLGGDSLADLDDDYEKSVGLPEFVPSCDPRREPSSMGLSFVIQGPANSILKVCSSFAFYQRTERGWQRCPRAFVHSVSLEASGKKRHNCEPFGILLQTRTQKLEQEGCYQVSLRLVHSGLGPFEGKIRTEKLVFQPQIRVSLNGSQRLVGLSQLAGRLANETGEDAKLQLIYREHPIKARGHFCSAVWRSIDPEQQNAEQQQTPRTWEWSDAQALEPGEAEPFCNCDLRTEFLPVSAVQVPSPSWDSSQGPAPLLNAEQLSECSTPQQVREALQPLLSGYWYWIEQLGREVEQVEPSLQSVAQQQLDLCQESHNRIQEGLRVLETDPAARLAFCFSQKALATQALWKDGTQLNWRPFQIAFFLQTLAGITDASHPDRTICDLLWFPTGGGKTEAYLAIVAYTAALRRLRRPGPDGCAVISRYTLRLLSIQQFRRSLGLMTACEYLRSTQWQPSPGARDDMNWGQHRFSVGLWVGGGVTPNRLDSVKFPNYIPGAVEQLTKPQERAKGEPAQVLECPCCRALLAVPPEVGQSSIWLHLVVKSGPCEDLDLPRLSNHLVKVLQFIQHPMNSPEFMTWSFELTSQNSVLGDELVADWWEAAQRNLRPLQLCCAHPTRPGYFLLKRGSRQLMDFAIYCPNPTCALAGQEWSEQPVQGVFEEIPEPFRLPNRPQLADRIAIPALTVDDQIYGWPPTLLLATVDKFARLAFEPRAATLFGQAEFYHPREGYYRANCHRSSGDAKSGAHPAPIAQKVEVAALPSPDLVLQDELHLVDGPLGSMTGLYETVVEGLMCRPHRPKYIASTATVREARDQVKALFDRELRQFPATGLSVNDNFFARTGPGEFFQEKGSGRLYLGLCAPGRGALTPLVRAWATILQAGQELHQLGLPDALLDPYWTPVGYFSAINQLATVAGLWRQYIPQRMQSLAEMNEQVLRPLDEALELSSRIDSQRLPVILDRLSSPFPNAVPGVLATSMFGTGVDVSRLSLMVVHGQPKTTSAYIQATGRVGRSMPGLVIAALSPARPRELNHYEYFTGYHLQLYRGVEPVTVFPFAPRARERGLGPAMVAWQRQTGTVNNSWRNSPHVILQHKLSEIRQLLLKRSQSQPNLRCPSEEEMTEELQAFEKAWRDAAEAEENLVYQQYSMQNVPTRPVVLGDAHHELAGLTTVFRNAPQSLREVESTTGFQV